MSDFLRETARRWGIWPGVVERVFGPGRGNLTTSKLSFELIAKTWQGGDFLYYTLKHKATRQPCSQDPKYKKLVRGLRKPRTSFLCRLYEQFAAYISRGLCKPRLIFPRINRPNDSHTSLHLTVEDPSQVFIKHLQLFSTTLSPHVGQMLLFHWYFVCYPTYFINGCRTFIYLIPIELLQLINPFTPKSDQCQIPSAASPVILHLVWGIWLFIAYSDERWLYYQFSLPHQYISL